MSATYSLDRLFDALIFLAEDEYEQPYEDLSLTKRELARLCAESVAIIGGSDCVWCGVDTHEIHEYYMVTNKVWKRYGPANGQLCIGCLEDQMGRKLQPRDFTKVQVNTGPDWTRSERLRDRLGLSDKPVSDELSLFRIAK